MITPATSIAAILTLIPLLVAAFISKNVIEKVHRLPVWAQLLGPAVLSLPYVLVTCAAGDFQWGWFALYLVLPVAIVSLLWQSARVDPRQKGNWRDFLILVALGLAVDLRWFESAWPAHLAIFGKMLLLDAGLYGFIVIRHLEGTGFDLRLKLRDAGIGFREFLFYTPVALGLGLSLGFLHLHAQWPGAVSIVEAWLFTFFFIAIPEELFFRGWLQNLLERRMGRIPALLVTAILFGLSHFNKRAAHFNWRYVLLAAIAGIFYGRAWRQHRRVGASAITHATVDAVWSLWLR